MEDGWFELLTIVQWSSLYENNMFELIVVCLFYIQFGFTARGSSWVNQLVEMDGSWLSILQGLAEIFQKYHLVMTNIAMEAMALIESSMIFPVRYVS